MERAEGAMTLIEIVCERERLDGFMCYAELVDTVEKRLKETGW